MLVASHTATAATASKLTTTDLLITVVLCLATTLTPLKSSKVVSVLFYATFECTQCIYLLWTVHKVFIVQLLQVKP